MKTFFMGLVVSCELFASTHLVLRKHFIEKGASIKGLPAHVLEITTKQMDDWKSAIVGHLLGDDVKTVLTGESGEEIVNEVIAKMEKESGGIEILFTGLGEVVESRTSQFMELGLLESIEIESFKREKQISEPFAIDYVFSKTEFKSALKEIIYAAGYSEALPRLLSAMATYKKSPTKIAIIHAMMKSIERKLPIAHEIYMKNLSVAAVATAEITAGLDTKMEKFLDTALEKFRMQTVISSSVYW